jgi:hypothetical protein
MRVDLADARGEHIDALLQLTAKFGEFLLLDERGTRKRSGAAVAELRALTNANAAQAPTPSTPGFARSMRATPEARRQSSDRLTPAAPTPTPGATRCSPSWKMA